MQHHRYKSQGGQSKAQGGGRGRGGGGGGRGGRGQGGRGQGGLSGESLFKESMLHDPWLSLTQSLVQHGVIDPSQHISFAPSPSVPKKAAASAQTLDAYKEERLAQMLGGGGGGGGEEDDDDDGESHLEGEGEGGGEMC